MRGAQQQADPSSAAKSRFLTNMSHEIGTPMNGLLAMAAVLLGKPWSAQQHERVQRNGSGRAFLAAPSHQFSDRLDEVAPTVLTDALPSNQRTL